TGCKACILVCPFGSITVGPSGKVVYKCDLCIERLEMDEEPACVSACPTGALRFGLVDDMRAAERLIASEGATDVPPGKCRLCGTEFASEARLKGIQRRLQKAFGEGFSIDLCPSCRRKEFGRILVESRR
ncbi:MAG TPA: hypothetical protein EYP17_03135, partial [Candidatus Latescibacteria bacterium]|nr:hypothetical protein [Candidatus Latescibacterota bacterium]